MIIVSSKPAMDQPRRMQQQCYNYTSFFIIWGIGVFTLTLKANCDVTFIFRNFMILLIWSLTQLYVHYIDLLIWSLNNWIFYFMIFSVIYYDFSKLL